MPRTYEPIATTTLATATNTVSFTSIPQTFTDIVIVSSGSTVSETDNNIRFNGDSGSNYSMTFLYGTGSTAASSRTSNQTEGQLGGIWWSSGIGNRIAHIFNYSNTTTNKTVLTRSNTSSLVQARVILWRDTSAISSLEIFAGANFISGTTFTLYGIKAA